MTVGSMVPEFDAKDIPHPSTRAPQGWWVDPAFASFQPALAEFETSLKRHGVLRQRHVQEVIRRCNSEEDLTMALSALEKLRRHRANALNHEPFNNHTCMLLMEKLSDLKAYSTAVHVLKRHNQLGLQPTILQVERLLGSNKEDLKASLKILDAARGIGITPTNDYAYSIARTAVRCGQRQTGIKVVKEMAHNGISIRPSVWKALKLADDGQPLPGEVGASDDDGPAGNTDPQNNSDDASSEDKKASADGSILPGVAR